jgi:hypothetical protein
MIKAGRSLAREIKHFICGCRRAHDLQASGQQRLMDLQRDEEIVLSDQDPNPIEFPFEIRRHRGGRFRFLDFAGGMLNRHRRCRFASASRSVKPGPKLVLRPPVLQSASDWG